MLYDTNILLLLPPPLRILILRHRLIFRLLLSFLNLRLLRPLLILRSRLLRLRFLLLLRLLILRFLLLLLLRLLILILRRRLILRFSILRLLRLLLLLASQSLVDPSLFQNCTPLFSNPRLTSAIPHAHVLLILLIPLASIIII